MINLLSWFTSSQCITPRDDYTAKLSLLANIALLLTFSAFDAIIYTKLSKLSEFEKLSKLCLLRLSLTIEHAEVDVSALCIPVLVLPFESIHGKP
jgi:hypothetical protein